MDLQDLIQKKYITAHDVRKYIEATGRENITKKDLDFILEKHGDDVLRIPNFYDLYHEKLRASNRRILFWLLVMVAMISVITFARLT